MSSMINVINVYYINLIQLELNALYIKYKYYLVVGKNNR